MTAFSGPSRKLERVPETEEKLVDRHEVLPRQGVLRQKVAYRV